MSSRKESILAWVAGGIVALSRYPALSKSPWEWDEALFILGVRHYDVAQHQPHAPGYPLFVGAARVFASFGASEFHALQAVVLLGALALFPVVFFLGREARFSFETSLFAAAIVAFMPNVWIYGGTAFSDLPAAVLAIAAAALFLRGCRSDRALVAAGAVLGIAIGFRPQSALIAAVPVLIAVAQRRLRPLLMSACICAVIVAAAYGLAAHLSHGTASYLAAVRAQSEYVSKVDSFHNPLRRPLHLLLADVFYRPFDAPAINTSIAILAVLGLISIAVRRRIAGWIIIAMFVPAAIAVWLYLDTGAISRYAVAYMPLFAFLAAEGLTFAPRGIQEAVAAGVIALMVIWTWPVLRELHDHPSPPADSVRWIRQHANPATSTIWTHDSMDAAVDALLPEFHSIDVGEGGPPLTAKPGDVYVREGTLSGATIFTRPRWRTSTVMRNRFFEVSVMPAIHFVTFGHGWYDEEGREQARWRWMSNEGRLILPPLHAAGKLTLTLYVPLDALRVAPQIEIALNGKLLDQFQPQTAAVTRTYAFDAQSANVVEICTSEVAKPANDPRLLGLRINSAEWREARP